jgi:DNA-binding SARP family transcriptional activator
MNIGQKIQNAIDATADASMALDEAHFALEIQSRLDVVAIEFMQSRPDLKEMSLDEWVIEHAGSLTADEVEDAYAIIEAYG